LKSGSEEVLSELVCDCSGAKLVNQTCNWNQVFSVVVGQSLAERNKQVLGWIEQNEADRVLKETRVGNEQVEGRSVVSKERPKWGLHDVVLWGSLNVVQQETIVVEMPKFW